MNLVSRSLENINNSLTGVVGVLPLHLRKMIHRLPPVILNQVEEVRLRYHRPLTIGLNSKDCFLHHTHGLTDTPEQAYIVNADDISRVIQLVSNSSIYALEEELRSGYITLPAGHRVGITGKVLTENSQVKTMKYISGFNIRVSRPMTGVADAVLKHLISPQGFVYHTMLISPPRCGKTTLLRDIIRQLSNGVPGLNFTGVTVGVVDERSEIAGCYHGIPQHDVGLRTDVLDACPKAVGMMMLLRSMSPQVIATDEIGRVEDVLAIEDILNAGVKVLTTVHGSSLEESNRRPVLTKLLQMKVIERLIILSRSNGVGTVEQIIDGSGKCLFKNRGD